MEESLQKYNSSQNLLEWSECVRECRKSGMSVKAWCEANGIALSTYYTRQRKVFDAAKEASKPAPEFAEVCLPKRDHAATPAATVRIGSSEADIYPGADEETIRTICRVLRSC